MAARKIPGEHLTLLIIANVVIIILATALYAYYSTPALLRGVSAGGGYWSGCDDIATSSFAKWKYATSPELQPRLESAFPAGTPEKKVIEALKRQGFTDVGSESCKQDASLHQARFDDGSIWASIIWRVDTQQNILWIRGSVAFHGI